MHEIFPLFVYGEETIQSHPSSLSRYCFVWPLLLDLGTEASTEVCPGTSDNAGTNIEVKQASVSAEPGADPGGSFQLVIAKKVYCAVLKICVMV